MTIWLVLLFIAVIGALILHKKGIPFMEWVTGSIVVCGLILVVMSLNRADRPEPTTAFENALSWKLGKLASENHAKGSVIVIQESILVKLPSGEAQQEGVREGLDASLKPVWKTLPTISEGETDIPGALNGRAKILQKYISEAGDAVAIISLVPLADSLNADALRALPPLYGFEMAPSPNHLKNIVRGEFGAIALPRFSADNTKAPSGKMQARFDQRFELVAP